MGFGTNGLSFATLRYANEARLPLFKNGKGEIAHSKPDGTDWTVSEWFEAMMGETGEFANLHKKHRRGDIDAATFKVEASKELADVAIYLDMLAKRCGIELGPAIIQKFNQKSEELGIPIYIGHDDDWHKHPASETEQVEPTQDEAIDRLAGQLYDNYCVSVGGKAWNGDPLPSWEEFGSDPTKQLQANGWRSSAKLAMAIVPKA